jgi:hypothetical protein
MKFNGQKEKLVWSIMPNYTRPNSKQTSSCFRFKIPLTIWGKIPLHSLSKPWNLRATFAAIIVVKLTFLLAAPCLDSASK